MKISVMDLVKLRRNFRVSEIYVNLANILFSIGEENLEESGVELIKAIQLLRGLSDEEIIKITRIRSTDFVKIMDGTFKITETTAKKLSELGYPKEAFRKK